MKKNLSFLLLLGLPCLIVKAQLIEGSPVDTDLSFEKVGGKVQVSVSLHYKVASDDPMTIGNLRDYYGTPGITSYLTGVTGTNGTIVKKKPSDSLVILPAGKEVNFNYTIAFDSARLSTSTYAPNTGEDHVHFAFCQWMLPITNKDKLLEYRIRIGRLPANWLQYSSVSSEDRAFTIRQSFSQAFYMIIGAGSFYKQSFNLNGRTLNVYIKGDFKEGKERMAELVRNIVDHQHRIFEDFDNKVYSVVLLNKEGNIAGINIPGMFLCHIKKDVDYPRLAWLISHEMQHRWVGKKLYVRDTSSFGLRHQWFSEGINDYLAYVGLLDSKLFSKEDFVNSINSYLRNIRENPYAAVSEDSMRAVADQGKYGVEATKIAYYKGMLMGFLADLPLLERSSGKLRSGLRDLIIKLSKMQLPDGLDESVFFTISDSAQLPLRELYRTHIFEGSPVFKLPASIFKNSYELKQVSYQVYDPGFTYSRENGKRYVITVDSTAIVYSKGLRVGMELIEYNGVNRFSNAWCDCPLKIVAGSGNQQISFEYMPRGKTGMVFQYVKK